eukprot:2921993-Ditylum_brightwellii.AAC.1
MMSTKLVFHGNTNDAKAGEQQTKSKNGYPTHAAIILVLASDVVPAGLKKRLERELGINSQEIQQLLLDMDNNKDNKEDKVMITETTDDD